MGLSSLAGAQGRLSGLDQRPENVGCSLLERPTASTGFRLEPVFEGLNVSRAVTMSQAPGDNSQWYIVERHGRVRSFRNAPDVDESETFLDIRGRFPSQDFDGEEGLKGLTFHPDWPGKPYAYASYVTPGEPLEWFVTRFETLDGGTTLDPETEAVLLHETGEKNLHLSGQTRFGPDGLLYIGVGDFGPSSTGQRTAVLQGSMLRIDVDDESGLYGIPADNPFANGGGAPEIFAWGLRQPWGWSFDRLTGEIWVGDVGKEEREEIDIITRGGNYGWSTWEGTLCKKSSCETEGFLEPIVDFQRDEARCIVGGFVYRGAAIPELFGKYIFGDWSTREVHALHLEEGLSPRRERIDSPDGERVLSFSERADGEIFVVAGSKIFQLLPEVESDAPSFPRLLSRVPCVQPENPAEPLAGLIPYAVNAPFWSDNAEKTRWFAIPDGTTIQVGADGNWDFPIGAVFLKHFKLAGQAIETRLFVRHADGGWGGYSYEWNDQQTDAVLLEAGKSKRIAGQNWVYPSRGDCLGCHTPAAGHVLGVETAQMHRAFTYPATGRTANQLATFEHIGLFSEPLPSPLDALPALVDPTDESAPLDARARAYLHANCSQCHLPGNAIPTSFDLRFDTPLAEAGLCDIPPRGDTLGLPDARLIAPGAPERSVLAVRLGGIDEYRMPPIAKNLSDTRGVALIERWILSRTSCDDTSAATRFLRGDSNQDLEIDIADAVLTLLWLFASVEVPRCMEALDGNFDAEVNITDATFVLNFLFLGGLPPAAPFPRCDDVEEEHLGCEQPACPGA